MTFDVTLLFTKIPLNTAMDELKKRLREENMNDKAAHLANICLRSTFFNEEFYEERVEAAMGSPLSPLKDNVHMEIYEVIALGMTRLKPKCWFRYVADAFIVWQNR